MRTNFSLNLSNVAIVLFVLGTIIPAISLADYINIPAERYFFKGLGAIFLTLSVMLVISSGRYKILRSELTFLVAILALPFAFALCASIYEFSESFVQCVRPCYLIL